jgi:hypothetical protein
MAIPSSVDGQWIDCEGDRSADLHRTAIPGIFANSSTGRGSCMFILTSFPIAKYKSRIRCAPRPDPGHSNPTPRAAATWDRDCLVQHAPLGWRQQNPSTMRHGMGGLINPRVPNSPSGCLSSLNRLLCVPATREPATRSPSATCRTTRKKALIRVWPLSSI